jgi:hypothetical protein
MPARHARSRDARENGAVQEACRALRKNSDARTIALATGMMFLSAISADAAGLFHHANVKSGNPLNGTEALHIHRLWSLVS